MNVRRDVRCMSSKLEDEVERIVSYCEFLGIVKHVHEIIVLEDV